MAEVSLHPPHPVTQQGVSLPSAFIPFCAVGQQFLGEKLANLSVPACTLFHPSVLGGQLCYQLDWQQPVGEGKDRGLFFVVDTGMEKSSREGGGRIYAHSEANVRAAKVYIHTLSRYTGYGPGSYEMTSVKKVGGSDRFLALPDLQKQCQMEAYEDCQLREFFTAGHDRCQCLPFGLNISAVHKVSKCWGNF